MTWGKRDHEGIPVLLASRVQKVHKVQREVKDLEGKQGHLVLLETKENVVPLDSLAIREAQVKREIKVTKEAMAHRALKERGVEWEFQANEDKLVPGDLEENEVELGVKDFLVLKEILGNQGLLGQLDLLVKMDQKDNGE